MKTILIVFNENLFYLFITKNPQLSYAVSSSSKHDYYL